MERWERWYLGCGCAYTGWELRHRFIRRLAHDGRRNLVCWNEPGEAGGKGRGA